MTDNLITYLDLGPPVPLGASVDEKSPSLTVTGGPAGSSRSSLNVGGGGGGMTARR